MYGIYFALLIFVCLVAASLGCLYNYERLAPHSRQEDTHGVVKLAANIFVVMTSLVLGLMVNSAKNTFEAIDHNIHSFATALILLDKSLRAYGDETRDTRRWLATYGERALVGTWPGTGAPLIEDKEAERLLDGAEASLDAIKPNGGDRLAAWIDVHARMQKVVELRWALVEDSESSIPVALIVMLMLWLTLIFASFGYRAPRNRVVICTLVVAAGFISASVYLIMDMDMPFSGPMQVSAEPIHRVLRYMGR
jgi:peptidoglycan/LPS O-acetylase OafA/YrhL